MTFTLVCVVAEPGMKTAAVAWKALTNRPLALSLLSSGDGSTADFAGAGIIAAAAGVSMPNHE